jgi:DNA-binding NarL/FixJ family response regulator
VTEPYSPGPSDRPLNVLIVDADRRVRQSLQFLCGCTTDLCVVGVAGDEQTVLDALANTPVDVCLIDPQLPDLETGLALVSQMHAQWPSLGVVVMSGSDSVEAPALAGGATAFIPKEGEPDRLIECLREVASIQVHAA